MVTKACTNLQDFGGCPRRTGDGTDARRLQPTAGRRRRTGSRARRLRHEDAESSVLSRHETRRRRGGEHARCRPGRAGSRAGTGRREADADYREPDPDRGERALRHAERFQGSGVGPGQSHPSEHPDRHRRYTRRSCCGRCGRGQARYVRRVGQLRRRTNWPVSSWCR